MPVDASGTWIPPKLRNSKVGLHMVNGLRGIVTDKDHARFEAFLDSPRGVICELETIGVDIDDHAVAAVETANAALLNLRKTLDQFRGVIGNDLTSIKASSARVQTETQAMAKRYQEAANLLTSPDFERAITNAERMAVALKAISELSETSLSVRVFTGGANEPAGS